MWIHIYECLLGESAERNKKVERKTQLLSVPFIEVHTSFVSVRVPLDVTAGEPISLQGNHTSSRVQKLMRWDSEVRETIV